MSKVFSKFIRQKDSSFKWFHIHWRIFKRLKINPWYIFWSCFFNILIYKRAVTWFYRQALGVHSKIIYGFIVWFKSCYATRCSKNVHRDNQVSWNIRNSQHKKNFDLNCKSFFFKNCMSILSAFKSFALSPEA